MNTSRLYAYSDLLLESTVLLPELTESTGAMAGRPGFRVSLGAAGALADVRTRRYDGVSGSDDGSYIEYAKLGEAFLLRFLDLADFVIEMPRGQVTCHPRSALAEETLRHLLLDQVLPRMIGQSGRLGMHASAVLHDRGVIVFVGRSGWGKSTLATSFVPQHGLFSDDFLLLETTAAEPSRATATANYSGARLWPDAIDALFADEPQTSGIAHYSVKQRVHGLGDASTGRSAVPVCGVFLLNDPVNQAAPVTAITPLQGKEALMLLVRRCFLLDAHDMGVAKSLWLQAGDLLRSGVPVAQLAYPRAHGQLADVRRAIQDYLQA